ncbi:MAG: carboxypeptidase regulatory-like domain-containing protein [Candidatus Pacebacteria bacterium]|nr:carboxypeptidase regulatory-like domain-containing protein [Candidatus Paceibacterota bacterium]MBP9700997.1 carboxypeptidase regulatory-like domain-containing protein [Candidatus Paceibacterota bacterium]
MKLYRAFFVVIILVFGIYASTHASATLGTIDPNNLGSYKAQIENTDLGVATTLNFGKFTTQSSKNITVSSTELRGWAWGEGIGWIVMNCADTTSGCSATNGNFKVANTAGGLLSGYAWGENAGWVNFGPFTNPLISTVKITGGEFGGTLGNAGYAWAENYGWIKFDCSSPTSCVKTDWDPSSTYQCNDGIDNDNDGDIDYPADSGCSSATDDNESSGGSSGGSTPQCRDGNDNDGDNLRDDLDPGCHTDGIASNPYSYDRDDTSEFDIISAPYACNDGRDNDLDGFVDLNDRGCESIFDNDETDPITVDRYQCSDGEDNDGDGKRDYGEDPGCDSAIDNNEVDDPEGYACSDGMDNDGDDLVDSEDPGCGSPTDDDEFNLPIDICILEPEHPNCIDPVDCENDPTNPACVQYDFCDEYPNDPECLEGSTYCETYPNLCHPIDGPRRIDVIGGAVRDILTGIVGETAKIAGIAAIGVAGVVSFLIANPFSLYDLLLLLMRLWSLLLVALGIKKKSNPWGTVYDSVTKQPIDPAYVVLMDMAGNEVATSITDIDGRYGFAVPPGTYTIIANKTNYEFPSKKLAGKMEDELYKDLYFGGPIVVTEEGGIIARDIPLDQLNFDWNEYAKNEQHRLRSYKRRDLLVARISGTLFIIGFIITGVSTVIVPSTFNIVLMSVYVIMALLRIFGFQVRPTGSVADTVTDMPLPFSVVRIVSNVTNKEITHKVADRTGKYYALVANGNYHVVVDRKNPDQSYTPVHVPDEIEIKKGYLKHDFKV